GGVVDDGHVGVDAVALDAPGAVELVEAEGGRGDGAAVDQARVAGDADEAAPGAGADELAEFRLLEVGGGGRAAGTRQARDEHSLGAEVGVRGPGPVVAVAPSPEVGSGAVEQLDESRGDLAAAVPAVVDDQGVHVALAVELADQLVLAVDACVRGVDVADLAA